MGTRTLAIAGIALLTGWTAVAAPAQAADPPRERRAGPGAVVASGLTDPFGLTTSGRRLVVTEAGAGRVLRIDRVTGAVRTVVDGLGPYAAASAARVAGRYYVVTGESDPSGPPGPVPGSSVLVARPGHLRPRSRAGERSGPAGGRRAAGAAGAPAAGRGPATPAGRSVR